LATGSPSKKNEVVEAAASSSQGPASDSSSSKDVETQLGAGVLLNGSKSPQVSQDSLPPMIDQEPLFLASQPPSAAQPARAVDSRLRPREPRGVLNAKMRKCAPLPAGPFSCMSCSPNVWGEAVGSEGFRFPSFGTHGAQRPKRFIRLGRRSEHSS
jgi:hypothetical protein